jgi:hypothetical protein
LLGSLGRGSRYRRPLIEPLCQGDQLGLDFGIVRLAACISLPASP